MRRQSSTCQPPFGDHGEELWINNPDVEQRQPCIRFFRSAIGRDNPVMAQMWPKKNFKRSNQASRIPEHDVDNADEFTDDEHIVIDVWPPSSVSAEVTWNRPNVATCSATAHSTGSLSPMYSSACTVEPFDDDHRSQSMEKRERSISPDTRRPSNARCSPNKRGCSDARWFSNVNEWSPCAKGSRNEPPSAVTRWFPMPPDPRCPVARDPHGGKDGHSHLQPQ
ncbi:hypothetical protein EMCRGX_G027557 [Ephydatia muelleri]